MQEFFGKKKKKTHLDTVVKLTQRIPSKRAMDIGLCLHDTVYLDVSGS